VHHCIMPDDQALVLHDEDGWQGSLGLHRVEPATPSDRCSIDVEMGSPSYGKACHIGDTYICLPNKTGPQDSIASGTDKIQVCLRMDTQHR
jgi:hypothetical protein